jgi:hypothetical protein
MGSFLSRRRAPPKDTFSLEEVSDGASTPPVVELDGEGPRCAALDPSVSECSGLVETADQLRLLCDADCEVKLGHGDWWFTHVYHAVFCTTDPNYWRAALDGLRRWQRYAQRRKRISSYPF